MVGENPFLILNMSNVGVLDFNSQWQFSASQSFQPFIVSNNHLLFLIGSKHCKSDRKGTKPLLLSHSRQSS